MILNKHLIGYFLITLKENILTFNQPIKYLLNIYKYLIIK